MSSWSGPYPPPPRRSSRSRSPRARAAYADPAYPSQEPYRADWDAYDRDRAHWATYERPPYDYSRRGRSRSPGLPDEGTSVTLVSVLPHLTWLVKLVESEDGQFRHTRETDTSLVLGTMMTMVRNFSFAATT